MSKEFLHGIILTLVTFMPLAGALLLLLFPRRDRDIRVFALVISLLTFGLSLHLPVYFQRHAAGFQYEVDKQWIASPNIHYHMGVDGISMWLILLTTFLTPLCVLISWTSVHDRVKEFFILLLILETALIGVFTALDLFLFYFFWESTLIPMALLIGMYGHGRKIYAAVKFFLFTMVASVFMLAAMLWLYAKTGSFDLLVIQNAIRDGKVEGFLIAAPWLFLGFFVAFAVKVPLFPVHTWLPDAQRRSANRGFRAAGRRHVEDGHLRDDALQPRPLSGTVAPQCAMDHGAGADRHRIRRAGGNGPAKHEEADCLFVHQPPWICRTRYFQLHRNWIGRC